MKALNFYSIILLVALLGGCNWFDPVEPKDPSRTYHWEGTLYKGLGEEVWPNVNVNLTGAHRTLAGPKYNTIAQGVTDANGHFRLEFTIDSTDSKYENEIGASYGVSFEVGGGYPLMGAPWKVDVERDIAQTDHKKVVCVVTDKQRKYDSIYLIIPLLFESKNQTGYEGVQIQINPLLGEENTFVMYSAFTSSWNNSPGHSGYLQYGVTEEEFRRAYFAKTVDSIPDDFNRIELEFRGFPFTDTVYLDL